MSVAVLPARRLWDGAYLKANMPDVIRWDDRPNLPVARWWWSGNSGEAGAFWHGYESAWLPATLLETNERGKLADAWLVASRHWSTTLHFNKGLAGGSAEAIAASRNTAMNAQVLDAFALAIIAADGPSAYAGLTDPNLMYARKNRSRISAAMSALRRATPQAGSYLSECDYDLVDWKIACWGAHWARLDAIKAKYDPDGIFVVHHGIGSESLAVTASRQK